MALPKMLTRAAGAAADAGGVVFRRLQNARVPGTGTPLAHDDARTAVGRWRVVTVLVSPDQVGTADALPRPLADFRDRIEIRVTPAPGDKGTELAARFRGQANDEDIGELRSALRRAKQLLEVGEVLRVDPVPHGRREQTPQGKLLEEAAAEAPKGGVL
ncbi:MAG: uncharacterized protein JWP62_2910 [Blastococcus sp.]|jgi:hypothetical protein|nr:uncharacterized protein [Blastococcus sp.]